MRIVTPAEVAGQTQNKYLGVLVAAKFARYVNDFPRDRSVDWEEKLTTRAFDELVRGGLKYRLVRRRRLQGNLCRSPPPHDTSCLAWRAASPVIRAVSSLAASPKPA